MKQTTYIFIIAIETLGLIFFKCFSFFVLIDIPLNKDLIYENCQENIFWEDEKSPYCLRVYDEHLKQNHLQFVGL